MSKIYNVNALYKFLFSPKLFVVFGLCGAGLHFRTASPRKHHGPWIKALVLYVTLSRFTHACITIFVSHVWEILCIFIRLQHPSVLLLVNPVLLILMFSFFSKSKICEDPPTSKFLTCLLRTWLTWGLNGNSNFLILNHLMISSCF